MDKRINQAINNLQTIANLAIDDDVIAEIATATVALLGEYAAQQPLALDGRTRVHNCDTCQCEICTAARASQTARQ